MSNSYILPLCFAAATHGALLFGFTKNPPVPKLPKEPTIITRIVMPSRDEEPPVVIETDAASARSKTAADVPQPIRGPEPALVLDTTRPTMMPPPFQPIGREDVRQILNPNLGIEGGKENGLWSDGIVSKGLLDNPPRTRFQSTPMYPHQAKLEGMNGEVFVDFVVDEQGRVLEPRVVKSSHPMFDEPTLRAVSKWKFEPGKQNGKVVKFRMTVPVIFNLNEGS